MKMKIKIKFEMKIKMKIPLLDYRVSTVRAITESLFKKVKTNPLGSKNLSDTSL